MSAEETHLYPDEVLTAAARAANVALDLRERIEGLVSQIRAVDVHAVSGNDEPGRKFLQSYNPAAADELVTGSEEICGHVYDLAKNVGVGVIETKLRDQEDANRMRALADDLTSIGAEAALRNQTTVDQVNELATSMQNPAARELAGDEVTTRAENFLEDVDRASEQDG